MFALYDSFSWVSHFFLSHDRIFKLNASLELLTPQYFAVFVAWASANLSNIFPLSSRFLNFFYLSKGLIILLIMKIYKTNNKNKL